MARAARTYGHFCTLARALEQVGDRWSLLILRDLLVAPRRFTDLMDRLGGITPTTLTQRLKELEAQGLVRADREPGRREVWYELTDAGRDLEPAIEALALWGLRHGRLAREPGERLHPEHLLTALRIVLARAPAPRQPVRWHFRFIDDGEYTLGFDGERWALTPTSDTGADVVVSATSDAWARYLTTPPPKRPAEPDEMEIVGTQGAVEAFRRAVAQFPNAA
jgi:DNA-binding HxlR family transcriptional regulator